MLNRRQFSTGVAASIGAGSFTPFASANSPIVLGIDGEFGLQNSTSAQAVERGVVIAAHQINTAGGLLNGRRLEIVKKDHRSISARGIQNIREFAANPDVVAVFGGRFSPVIIEQLPLLREARLPFLAVWSAADAIVDNGSQPNYVFRLSLRDSLAMPHMLETARKRGIQRVGLLLTNTAWGRSNNEAAQKFTAAQASPKVVATGWYNWQERSLVDRYRKLLEQGAQAVVLVANDDEAALLVREMAALPAQQRVPILSHWGVTGGRFVESAGPALRQVDFSVIQTFSFFKAARQPLQVFMKAAGEAVQLQRIEDIESPVGVAHAYDMTHILAKAITLAKTTERSAVRDALEKVREHNGLVRRYAPPFTPTRHEALGPEQLLMARYREDGVLVPAAK